MNGVPPCVACGAAHHPSFDCRPILRERAQARACGAWSFFNDGDCPYTSARPDLVSAWREGYDERASA